MPAPRDRPRNQPRTFPDLTARSSILPCRTLDLASGLTPKQAQVLTHHTFPDLTARSSICPADPSPGQNFWYQSDRPRIFPFRNFWYQSDRPRIFLKIPDTPISDFALPNFWYQTTGSRTFPAKISGTVRTVPEFFPKIFCPAHTPSQA